MSRYRELSTSSMSSSPGSKRPASRFDSVDLLRGLGVIAVVLRHAFLGPYFAGHATPAFVPVWVFQLFFSNGSKAMYTFFSASGFLITFTAIRRFGSLKQMHAKTFYSVRFARIMPVMLALVALLSVLHLVHAGPFRLHGATLGQALLAVFTFHMNWQIAKHGLLQFNWGMFWSLSIEEMFYLFFPVICIFFLQWRRGMVALVLFFLLFAAMGPFARSVWAANELWRRYSYLANMDAIALGCLAALLTDKLERSKRIRIGTATLRGVKAAGIVVMMVIIVGLRRWHWLTVANEIGVSMTLLEIGTCLYIVASVLQPREGRAISKPVRWLGRYAYEIYLTHYFVVIGMTALYVRYARGPLLAWILVTLVISGALGGFIAHVFSEPMNRWLRRVLISSRERQTTGYLPEVGVVEAVPVVR